MLLVYPSFPDQRQTMKRVFSCGDFVARCLFLFSIGAHAFLSRAPLALLRRLAACLLATGAAVSSAQTAPAVTSIARFSDAAISAGGSVIYTVGYIPGTDPVTSLSATLVDSSGRRRIAVAFTPSSGTGYAAITSDTSWLNGAYTLAEVTLTSYSGRNTTYFSNGAISRTPVLAGAPATHSLNFSVHGFQFTGGVSAVTTPVLNSIARTSAATAAAGSTLTYTVGYTRGTDVIHEIRVHLTDPSGAKRTFSTFTPSSGGTLSLASTTAWPSGTYALTEVEFHDAAGRVTVYQGNGAIVRSPALVGAPTTHSISFSGQGLQLTGGVGGVMPSVLTSVTRTSPATMSPEGTVLYTTSFTHGSDRIQRVVAVLAGPSGTRRELTSFSPPSGEATLRLAVDSAWPVGDYALTEVVLTDETGRATVYRAEGSIVRSPAIAGAPTAHSLAFSAQGFQLVQATVSLAPRITVQPQSQSVALRGSVSFIVAATGAGTLTYQWAKNGVSIPGATSETLVLTNLQNSDAGNYTVVVANRDGATTSNVATLAVTALSQAPIFTQQPANVAASDGAAFTVDVRVLLPDSSAVTWRANVGGRSVAATVTSSAWANDVLAASLSFGPVTLSDAGLFQVVANNVHGFTLSEARILTVNPVAPAIATQPRAQSVAFGDGFALSVEATGTGPLSYRWRRDSADIPGATLSTYAVAAAAASDGGTYAVVVTNRVGSVESSAATVRVAAPAAPAITTQPATQTARVGAALTLTVVAESTRPLSYQWYKDGLAIAGATSPELFFPRVALADAGTYHVVATNSLGTVQSATARLTIVVPEPARLVNLSLLTPLAAGESFTLGFVVGGDLARAAKPVLVRAGGPSLAQFGVGSPHGDPALELFAGQEKVDQNDDWGGSPALGALFAAVGAYPFIAADSKDAALHGTRLPSGGNSVRVSGSGAASGTVLAELYETTPAGEMTTDSPRLLNVSVMKEVGSGMTIGFVLGGTGSKRVLVRAVGPGLQAFGVAGVLVDPALTLFDASRAVIRSNDNWDPAQATIMQAVGAFALPANSKDAALVAAVAAGSYTLEVSGVDGATGLTLVEVYELP